MIFTKFANWDRYSTRFGYVSVSRETLRFLLELCNEESIAEAGKRHGAQVPKEAMLFWFKRTDVETFLSYLENKCKFGSHAEYECEESSGNYTITLRHEHGKLWSCFLRNSIDEALRNMFGIVAQIESTESEVAVRFHAPRAKSNDLR
jgi:hypothetical protein